ncbi:hypothetical protein B0H11DRAFT_2218442 [Mycena galericulata]|nr:hypothetical protein B0H11DRAFT_2218442 [Mycena galericulata]
MNAVSRAGIYVIVDLTLSLNGSIETTQPAWDTNLFDQYIKTNICLGRRLCRCALARRNGRLRGRFWAPNTPQANDLFNARGSQQAHVLDNVHALLKPLTPALASPPHIILTELSSILSSPSLRQESLTLHLLSLFLSPRVQPLRKWDSMYASLRSAMDRFDANALAAFDAADSRGDEEGMREAAESSWEVWDGDGDWEMGKVWAEKREIFYQQGQWRPLDNLTHDGALAFDAMDEFMGGRHPRRDQRAQLARRCRGVHHELFTHACELSDATYLKAAAATFREAWRIVDAIVQAAAERPDAANVPRTRAEDVVYQMFEINVDEYLDEEVESVKQAFEVTCKGWDRQMAEQATGGPSSTRFLSSHNPAQVKRNVLASFTSVLLIPVMIGIAMLNPQRWGGGNTGAVGNGYSRNLELEKGTGTMLFDGEDDEEEKFSEKIAPSLSSASSSVSHLDLPSSTLSRSTASLASGISTPLTSSSSGGVLNKLELLLSLNVALELTHANHEALTRVETFVGYPGHYGLRALLAIHPRLHLLVPLLRISLEAASYAAHTDDLGFGAGLGLKLGLGLEPATPILSGASYVP